MTPQEHFQLGDHPEESLTGEWRGHYAQHDTQRQIIAWFTQDGDRITGEMTDVDTENAQSLYDATAEAGLPPGTDEQIAERLHRLIPDATTGAITFRWVLPEKSSLEGTVNGEFVQFTKTYLGQPVYGYEIGDKGIEHTTEGHSVEYSGRLSTDRMTITGRWTIYQAGVPRGFFDGSFELRRA